MPGLSFHPIEQFMSDQQIQVRRAAGEADASSCASIMASTDPWKTLGRKYDDTFRMISDAGAEVFVAVTPDEEVVGLVQIRMIPVFKGYIAALAVHEAWRNQGIGTMLLEFAEERIFRESPNVFLCCSSFNHDAMRLYLFCSTTARALQTTTDGIEKHVRSTPRTRKPVNCRRSHQVLM